jgi:hypothetical protein
MEKIVNNVTSSKCCDNCKDVARMAIQLQSSSNLSAKENSDDTPNNLGR